MATLGEHHREYNEVLRNTIAKNLPVESTQLDPEAEDIDNLLKIDIVCNKRDVEALLEIFKSEDMLYVSRAIKRSTWLITDPKYAHIVHPEYLYAELLPHMTMKGFIKFLSHVRLNLRDERRVEDFYKYEAANNVDKALRWLPHCSVAFIEEVVKSDVKISNTLLDRLCEKSFTIINAYLENCDDYDIANALEISMFLLSTHPEMYLDTVETHNQKLRSTLSFGKKYTKLIMKKYPERVFNNFEIYADKIDLKTFVKFIKKENIQDFLLKYSKSENLKYFFTFNKLTEFIMRMPVRSRFDFVRKHFIDVGQTKDKNSCDDSPVVMYAMATRSTDVYDWYKFAPFEVAFGDLKKLIRAESSPTERRAMLAVLVSCAGRNASSIHTLLQYYHDRHINEPFIFKNDFVKLLIERTDTHTYDDASWKLLNILFRSMEVYKAESTNNVQSCIRAIILYNVLHDEDIPEVIETKFEFNTFKKEQNKLKQHEKEAMFKYLYNYAFKKIENVIISDESGMKHVVKLIEDILRLLVDWNEALPNHPSLLKKIKDVALIKKEKDWKINLSSIYNTNKSWRKYLFEESVLLCPSELVCMNALKHEPALLTRYRREVESLCGSDDVSLRRLLAKMRVYWRGSLADHWARDYEARLKAPSGHSAAISGLFTLLSQRPLLDVVAEFAPQENKVNWSTENELILSLRKNIALKMHIARPLIPIDSVLLYAKGDYLQYAVPSLNAVLYNVSKTKFRVNILKLLDAPVSLQKFGLRFASTKLEVDELIKLFKELWVTSKNLTIRNVVFTLAYDLLCKEKKPSLANTLTALLCEFIDDLGLEENKDIYKKMCRIFAVPMQVQAQLYEKTYIFMDSLPRKPEYAQHIRSLIYYAPQIMDKLNPDFVEKMFMNNMVENFTTNASLTEIFTSFILFTDNEDVQIKRYEDYLVPILDLLLTSPQLLQNDIYRINLQNILCSLYGNLDNYLMNKNSIIPVKLMSNVLDKLQIIMPVKEHYVQLTFWKLMVTFVKLLDEHKCQLESASWKDLLTSITPHLADKYVEYLKEDVAKYFPSIYLSFSKALGKFLIDLIKNDDIKYTILKLMLREDFIQSYFLAYSLWPDYLYNEKPKALGEIRKILFSHPSVELKMHYYTKFSHVPLE